MTLATQQLSNGETVAHITLYGINRDPRVLEWHKRVMVEYWHVPVNYLLCPFDQGMSHGFAMNELLRTVVNQPDTLTYLWFWDNDCILLRRDGLDQVIDIVRNKGTVWGHAWSSSHKLKPGGGKSHPYASQACLCVPTSLYKALGCPDCDHHNPRSDTAEEITFECEQRGFVLALQYPSSSDEPYTVQLSQTCRYGRSIVYGSPPTYYHETRADLDGHADRFVAIAQKVIAGEFEV